MADDRLPRIREALAAFPEGMHTLGTPASMRDTHRLPMTLGAFYQLFNGAELFHEALVLAPVDAVIEEDGRYRIGEQGRDVLYVDRNDVVWRRDDETGDLIHEGTRFDRWLDGYLAGESLLYDESGEFNDFVIDDSGEELTPPAAVERERRAHKRDRNAAGPHWRLARALQRSGDAEAARDELEHLVDRHPSFGWAWFDLARIAESLGDTEGAIEDAVAAADADPTYEHAGYFLAFAAKLAAPPRRTELATRALALDPDLARVQRDGAAASLAEGNEDAARELLAIALALAPRDLEALALAKKLG